MAFFALFVFNKKVDLLFNVLLFVEVRGYTLKAHGYIIISSS